MNIEDFVKESLGQIFRGMRGAATVAQATGATIDPRQYGVPGTTDDYGRSVQSIMFDVAVTVTETGDIKGGISVMGIGVKGATSELSSTVSRIKFRVPVVLPTSAESRSYAWCVEILGRNLRLGLERVMPEPSARFPQQGKQDESAVATTVRLFYEAWMLLSNLDDLRRRLLSPHTPLAAKPPADWKFRNYTECVEVLRGHLGFGLRTAMQGLDFRNEFPIREMLLPPSARFPLHRDAWLRWLDETGGGEEPRQP